MKLDELVMGREEKLVFLLRGLYERTGYRRYKMNKFEEYDLYVRNKDFLVSDHVITFTDTGGRLMALKPDVTLSIVKNSSGSDAELQKLYYHENVYRVSKGTGAFREITQVGLECLGPTDGACVSEVLRLAALSLEQISPDFVLDVSHMGVIAELMDGLQIQPEQRQSLLQRMGEKNAHELQGSCGEALRRLIGAGGSAEETARALAEFYPNGLSPAAQELLASVRALEAAGFAGRVRIDLSVLNDMNYYSGLVFKGFIQGIAQSILAGGQYDHLMRKMGRRAGAVGFAVYLDLLDRFPEPGEAASPGLQTLHIALPKGRLGEQVYARFEQAGFACPDIREPGRRLIFENAELALRYFWVKPSDVAIYVERGAADVGVCGKDILLESRPDVYELADLKLGKCAMAVAAKEDFCDDPQRTLRVATKFTHIAESHFRAKGRDIDIIHLNGSIELAPVLGLSDVIVDIVETGTTLRENHLAVVERILPISARLIANKSSLKFKSSRIGALTERLRAETEELS